MEFPLVIVPSISLSTMNSSDPFLLQLAILFSFLLDCSFDFNSKSLKQNASCIPNGVPFPRASLSHCHWGFVLESPSSLSFSKRFRLVVRQSSVRDQRVTQSNYTARVFCWNLPPNVGQSNGNYFLFIVSCPAVSPVPTMPFLCPHERNYSKYLSGSHACDAAFVECEACE